MTRDDVEATAGPMILEFGASWCGICAAAKPLVAALREEWSDVPFHWIEDGKGVPLGRSFGVKLWPTFVFLRDGKEVARVVRPRDVAQLRDAARTMAPR